MRLHLILRVILVMLLAATAISTFSQVPPAATQGGLPLTVGGGISSFSPDFNHGRILGGTVWIDYIPQWLPKRLYGLGLEVEGRDLNYGRDRSQPSNLREDVAGGGVIYSWRHYQNLRPYGKFLGGFGNADTLTTSGVRHHDSRALLATGGGLEYRAYRSFWVRADYEYQFWLNYYFYTKPPGQLNPQGFTVGVSYDLSRLHFLSR
jgi:opacity protein-like surface antigen